MQKEQKIKTAYLQEISAQTGLAFSKLLGAAVLEEVARIICESEYSGEFWLRNASALTRESYERNLKLRLEFDYVIQKPPIGLEELSPTELLIDVTSHLKAEVFEEQDGHRVELEVDMKAYPKYVRFDCVGKIEDMKVPVTVIFHYLQDENLAPKKETFSLTAFPGKEVSYNSFQPESILAEKYMEIVTKLELIQSLKSYYDVYYLLERESVDGRKVRDYINDQCGNWNVPKDMTRLEMVKMYKNYAYMKKKWKVFLRSIHCKEPEWDQVMERFVSFFEPIWKAVIEDFIFFGDWMPELNRFL
ncbi:MAG: hypothetical protein NC307_04670 [Roseburia sp.]|nr:hypothetical protein [Roseburia sp.]